MPGQGQSAASVRSGNAQRARQDRRRARRARPAPPRPAPPSRVRYAAEHTRPSKPGRSYSKPQLRHVLARAHTVVDRQRRKAARQRVQVAHQRAGRLAAGRFTGATNADTARAERFKRSDAYFRAMNDAAKARYQHAAPRERARLFGTTNKPATAAQKRGLDRASRLGIGGDYFGTVMKDALDLTVNTPASLYLAGKAGVHAAQGHPRELKQLWRGFKHTDPLALAAQGKFGRALHQAKQHPLSTALELSGGEASVGRTLGAAARHAPSSAVRKAASTARPNLRLTEAAPGKGPEIRRTYSRDVIRKAAQKGFESTQRRLGRDPHVDLGSRARPSLPSSVHGARRLEHTGDPQRMRPGRVRGRVVRDVDTSQHAHEGVRRERAAQVTERVSKIVPLPRGSRYPGAAHKGMVAPEHGGAVQLAAEGVARHHAIRAGLSKHLRDLNREYAAMRKADLRKIKRTPEDHADAMRANRAQAKHVRELAALSDENLQRVAHASGALAGELHPQQAALQRVGVTTAVEHAQRFRPFLSTHGPKVPKTELRRAHLSPAERKVAAKSLQRRARRGKTLTKQQAAIVMASEREAERAAKAKRQPGTPLASALARVALGEAPRGALRPRPTRDVVTRGAFNDYLRGVRHRRAVPARSMLESEQRPIARQLERRARRGKPLPQGLPPGGPVFITQRAPKLGRHGEDVGAYRPKFPANPSLPGRRKGTAFAQGTREIGAEAVMRQARLADSIKTAVEGFHHTIRRWSVPGSTKAGRHYGGTRGEAEAAARRYAAQHPEAPRMLPVNISGRSTRVFGGKLRAAQASGMPVEHGQVAGAAWHAALNESGRGRWVLMPEDVVQREMEHAGVRTNSALARGTGLWKDIVLTTTSPGHWTLGNAADLAQRSLNVGMTPLDVARGTKISRAARQHGYTGEAASASLGGGGFLGSSGALGRTFRSGRVGEGKVKSVAALPWRAWKASVYGLNRHLEEAVQAGAVGKAFRTSPERLNATAEDHGFAGAAKKLLRIQSAQVEHFAKTLSTDDALLRQTQKFTEDVIGRWGKLSPATRRLLVVAPFAQWLGAATRYTLVTLPLHHPIKTGIVAAISGMTEPERKKLGLSYYLPRSEQAQEYQQGSLPTDIGHNKYGLTLKGIGTQRFSSQGTVGGLLSGQAKTYLFPQLSSALDAWQGQAYTGQELTYPDWWPDPKLRRLPLDPEMRNKVMLGMLIEANVPFASAARRVGMEKGLPAELWSTILTPALRQKRDPGTDKYAPPKGGSAGKGLERWLSPQAAATKKSTILTYGALKDIQAVPTTMDTLKRWSDQRKGSKSDLIDVTAGGGDPLAPKKAKKKPAQPLIDVLK